MREIIGAYILEVKFFEEQDRERSKVINTVELPCQTLYVNCSTIFILLYKKQV